MKPLSLRLTVRLVLLLLALEGSKAAAHNPALDPPEPTSVPEAWNIITQCTANVQTLIDTNQLREIAYQIANCSPAIRVLQSHVAEQRDSQKLAEKLEQLFNAGGAVIIAARQPDHPQKKAQERYKEYQALVKAVAGFYEPKVVNADIFICPMHPKDRHLNANEKCTFCRMSLIKRRIATSSIYEAPGESSIVMSASADTPLKAGQAAKVTIRLARRDGSPVVPSDLLVMHTQRIHLLIVDQSLSDYHHVHPDSTDTPGEYVFAFMPKRPGPYRIWADVVPAATSIQEYVIADLQSDARGGAIDDRASKLSALADGMQFTLNFDTKEQEIRAGEPVLGHLTVTGSDGKPFLGLEPVMGAFGHFVGFCEDYQTVIHVHPADPEPDQPNQRGGPTLPFFLYAPKPGYMRFYVQVRIAGSDRFVPFGLNIGPAASGPPK